MRWCSPGKHDREGGGFRMKHTPANENEPDPPRLVRRRAAGGRTPGGVDAAGVLDSRRLPDAEFLGQWRAVIIDEAQRDRLLGQAVLNFTLRPKVDRARLPLHGLIVLHGPPGTGKTS